MSNQRRTYFLILLAAIFLVGCATTSKSTYGKDFNESAKDSLVKGASKKADLIKLLGEPQDKGIDEQNREWWVYIYQEGAYTYNAFDGMRGKTESQVRTKKLVVTFEGDIVKNFVFSDSTTPSTARW